jgi:hypothetical protein
MRADDVAKTRQHIVMVARLIGKRGWGYLTPNLQRRSKPRQYGNSNQPRFGGYSFARAYPRLAHASSSGNPQANRSVRFGPLGRSKTRRRRRGCCLKCRPTLCWQTKHRRRDDCCFIVHRRTNIIECANDHRLSIRRHSHALCLDRQWWAWLAAAGLIVLTEALKEQNIYVAVLRNPSVYF